MTQNLQNAQSQLTLTLPRDVRAQWHALAMTHGLRPAGLAVAMLHAVDTDPATAHALGTAAEEVRRDH